MKNSDASLKIRRVILEQSFRTHNGHIGCCLGIVDILSVLYGKVLRKPFSNDVHKDIFVLSKGHAALALYATLHVHGFLKREELLTFHGDGTKLGIHPEAINDQIKLATGSLGHGLSVCAGIAIAGRNKKSAGRVFALLSDAECDEGSVWEAVSFIAHHSLTNVTAIVDLDGQQAFGFTKDVLDMSPLAEKFATFGWKATIVNGHNEKELEKALSQAPTSKPHVIIARTILGKGVSFMEGKIEWHYLPITQAQFDTAMEELS